MDRRISEMFTLGGTGILCHKYLGPTAQGVQQVTTSAQNVPGPVIHLPDTTAINLGDTVTATGVLLNSTVVAKNATTITISANTTSALGIGVSVGISPTAARPSYTNQSEQNIQDLLWLENRDRKYDQDVYKMRGLYQRADQDFDLSQFGLFLATGTVFMTFHLRDMVDQIGRKLMAGDVLELQHLTDYDALNQDVPAALKRFYVVGDASMAAEGFGPSWWPHLWRVKLNPLVDSQEYKDILNNLKGSDGTTPIGQLLSTLDTNLRVNDAIIKEAENNVPESGYNVSSFYNKPLDAVGKIPNTDSVTSDNSSDTVDNIRDTADEQAISPGADANGSIGAVIQGYLTGDTQAPNGLPMNTGIVFPTSPAVGEYFLRTDYLPNRVFRYNGTRWVAINDAQRTSLTRGTSDITQLGTFVNASGSFVNGSNVTVPVKQSLSNALTPKADN
jgi:hypothetical protein